jgi:hypothetical protein
MRGTRARARRDACKLPANERAEAAARHRLEALSLWNDLARLGPRERRARFPELSGTVSLGDERTAPDKARVCRSEPPSACWRRAARRRASARGCGRRFCFGSSEPLRLDERFAIHPSVRDGRTGRMLPPTSRRTGPRCRWFSAERTARGAASAFALITSLVSLPIGGRPGCRLTPWPSGTGVGGYGQARASGIGNWRLGGGPS